LAALAFLLFGFVFLFSGLISLVVAAIRYRPNAIK
jgi:Mn2+/Fe2+ NRAMP family transporter